MATGTFGSGRSCSRDSTTRARATSWSKLGEKNDRLRSVAYTWFEHNPDKPVVPRLLEALEREESEFVRPALTRALAAYGATSNGPARRDRARHAGTGLFRSVVIEALGDSQAAYAIKPITDVAKLDGPLQDDAVLALGKIGDKASFTTLAELQRTAPRESQPAIAAAICLLGVNCASHQPYITDRCSSRSPTSASRSCCGASATALAMLGASGRKDAVVELIHRARRPTRDPVRAAIVLALGTVALRNTPLLLNVLERSRCAPARSSFGRRSTCSRRISRRSDSS